MSNTQSISHFYPCPNMLPSLLPVNVLKIASGGVHNLCIVETNKYTLQFCLYLSFMASDNTDYTFVVEGVKINVHRIVLVHRSRYFKSYFDSKKDIKEEELKGVRYSPFRILIDFIYLNDLSLLDQSNLDKELVDVYKLAKRFGIQALQIEACRRLQNTLQDISIEGMKEPSGAKKKYKAENMIPVVSKIADIYEKYINSFSSEPHKVIMLPTGAVIIDERQYQALIREGIPLPLPDATSSTGISHGQQQSFQKTMTSIEDLSKTSTSIEEAKEGIVKDDLTDILKSELYSDFVVIVENKKIKLHKVVLSSRSEFFSGVLKYSFKEKSESMVNIKDCSYDSFWKMLEHIYDDNAKIDYDSIFVLMEMADRFGVQYLKKRLECVVVNYIVVENAARIFKYANRFNYERLRNICRMYINDHYTHIINTEEFEELDKEEIIKIVRMQTKGNQ